MITSPRSRRKFGWQSLIVFLLVLALLSVVLVQARQVQLLQQTAKSGQEFSAANSYQLETEYGRLREVWQDAARSSQALDSARLQLRYDIWISRVDLLLQGTGAETLRKDDLGQQVLEQAQNFIIAADRVLGARPSAVLTPEFVESHLGALEAMAPALRALTLSAGNLAMIEAEQRTEAVREQNALGQGLTAFLSLLTLGFAWVVARQLKALRARRLEIEELGAQLRQARGEALAASEARSASLATLSLEIRTPLQRLKGTLSLLRETDLTDEQIEVLHTASGSVDHMSASLDAILDTSAPESGRMSRVAMGVSEDSSVTIRMPPAATINDSPRPEEDGPVRLEPARLDPVRPLQILVAEDHPINQRYLASLLSALGHAAHFVADGQAALQAVQERSFDLVLMDLRMPLLDGLDTTRAIRDLADPACSTLPIVALTSDALEVTQQRCTLAGMNDFLSKPVSPEKLAALLLRLFGSAPSTAGVRTPASPGTALRAPAGEIVDSAGIEALVNAMSRAQYADLVRTFLQQVPDTARRFRSAIRDAEPLALRANAHAAKGAGLKLGLTRMAATAQALQEGASHLSAHDTARLVQRYEEVAVATRLALVEMALLAPSLHAAEPSATAITITFRE